jgi:hypothetical protein
MSSAYSRATEHSDSSMRNCDRSHTDSLPSSIPSLERHGSTASPTESEIFDYQRASDNTYRTTVASTEDYEDDYHYDYYDYYEKPRNEAIPATPAEFAQLFPSNRRCEINHDDSSVDGDMNIRVDTNVGERSAPKNITLFHLRMYDLLKREFSLRRYGRDCGREVAHTHQKVEKPASPKRPGLQRSVSRAFQSFRGKSEPEKPMTLNRIDSGYGSSPDDEEDEAVERPKSRDSNEEVKTPNLITLEFSNYAHVQVTRKGTKGSRKYDFEYWGKNYSWKRLIRKLPATGEDEISYQLVNNVTGSVVAYIVPDPPSPQSTEMSGEFVPPCSFFFRDSPHDPIHGPADVADVIMATGLMALVDDCIKRKYRHKKVVQLNIPLPMTSHLKMNMEYVGPKRLIDEVFNRRPTMHTRTTSSPASSPSSSPSRRR